MDDNIDFKSYSDEELRITINYPNNWTVENDKDLGIQGRVRFESPQVDGASKYPRPYFLIDVDSLSEHDGTNTEQIAKNDFEEDSNLNERAKIIQPFTNMTLDGHSATEITYSYSGRQTLAIWTVRDDKVYILRYYAEIDKFNEFLPKVQSMINSCRNRV